MPPEAPPEKPTLIERNAIECGKILDQELDIATGQPKVARRAEISSRIDAFRQQHGEEVHPPRKQ